MPDQQRENLRRELEALRRAVLDAALAPTGRAPDGQHLALVRLCRGLSPAMWLELGLQEHDPELLVLPLSGDLSPHLARLASMLEDFAAREGIDSTTGLPGADAFQRQLDSEIERAVRTKTSLSMALLRLGGCGGDGSGRGGNGLEGDTVARLAEVMVRSTRRYDVAARLSDTEFALVLPGAGMHKTRILLERIIGELDDAEGPRRPPVCAGIASIKGIVRVSPRDMLELAREALAKTGTAREQRVVAAPIPDIGLTPKATLVQASEKQFLFTGR